MELHKRFVVKILFVSFLSLAIDSALSSDNTYATTQISSSECYDNYGQPRVSLNISDRSIISSFDNFYESSHFLPQLLQVFFIFGMHFLYECGRAIVSSFFPKRF